MPKVINFFDPGSAGFVEDGVWFKSPLAEVRYSVHHKEEYQQQKRRYPGTYAGQAAYIETTFHDLAMPCEGCVIDAVSPTYYPTKPPFLDMKGRSGGEYATLLMQLAMQRSQHTRSLYQAFGYTNQLMLEWHRNQQIDLTQLEDRAGLCAAAFRYVPEQGEVKVAQIGDTLIFAKLRSSSKIWMTRDQVALSGKIGEAAKQRYAEAYPGDKRQQMIAFYQNHIEPARYSYANVLDGAAAYGFLNGQGSALVHIVEHSFSVDDLEWLALVTDGALPGIYQMNEHELGQWLYKTTNRPYGVEHLLRTIRCDFGSQLEASGTIISFAG